MALLGSPPSASMKHLLCAWLEEGCVGVKSPRVPGHSSTCFRSCGKGRAGGACAAVLGTCCAALSSAGAPVVCRGGKGTFTGRGCRGPQQGRPWEPGRGGGAAGGGLAVTPSSRVGALQRGGLSRHCRVRIQKARLCLRALRAAPQAPAPWVWAQLRPHLGSLLRPGEGYFCLSASLWKQGRR